MSLLPTEIRKPHEEWEQDCRQAFLTRVSQKRLIPDRFLKVTHKAQRFESRFAVAKYFANIIDGAFSCVKIEKKSVMLIYHQLKVNNTYQSEKLHFLAFPLGKESFLPKV